MSGYIGNIPVPQATQTRQTFTATASQTTFNTIGYTPRFLDVFLNGVKLVDGTDYTATNGSDVVLTTGAAASDILDVVAFNAFDAVSQNFTDGITVDNNGATVITADRQTSDGTVIDVQKNGTSVGNIGVAGSTSYMGNSQTNLRFVDGTPKRILPASTSGAASDNIIDLGNASNRFKDLYLSGGVYLGGTGSANHLDDYEEGTWTPSLGGNFVAGSYNGGDYIRVGNTVYINATVDWTSGTGNPSYIGGIPFNGATSSVNQFSANSIPFFEIGGVYPSSGQDVIYGRIGGASSTNSIQILQLDLSSGTHTGTPPTFTSSGVIRFSCTYKTS